MRSKIRQLKKLFQENHHGSSSQVVPERYVDFCEGDDMPAGLFEKKITKFRFYFTKYPNLQSPSGFVSDLNGTIMSRFSSRSFQIHENSIQQKLFDRLFGTLQSFDNTWFQRNDEFVRQLPTRDKFALVAMTNKSQQHIQAHLKGGDTKSFKERVRKWRPLIHGYLPIFFPLYEKHKKRLKDKDAECAYNEVINKICPSLSDDEIEECLVELVRQVRRIFSLCPKTTQKMTLWRGLRTVPDNSYAGFTSLSLNPLHTLNYTGNECCLQKLTILKGTPLIFIGGLSSFKNELECVLPDGLSFYEIKKSVETIPTLQKIKGKCPTSKDIKRILIQHAVVL